MFSLICAGAFGYLLGSIPAAYLFVRWKAHIDIRRAGSGNVGMLNSFEVTRSSAVAAGVLVFDVGKGACAVLLARYVLHGGFETMAVAGIGSVVGHCYPIWLRFRGGRGLATAAGVVFAMCWPFVLIWCVCWFVGMAITRDVNVGNAIATILTMAAGFLIGHDLLGAWISVPADPRNFPLFMTILLAIILTRHVQPVREYIAARWTNSRST